MVTEPPVPARTAATTSPLGPPVSRDKVGETRVLEGLMSKLWDGRDNASRLSRYVVLDRIGRGGFGSVHRGFDPQLRRDVAVKIVSGRRNESERLLREARALARISHPNVVPIYDVGRVFSIDDDRHEAGIFIVMELVPGCDLRDWLAQRPRSWPELRPVLLAAGRGLAAVHDRNLVHRDFKPGNVLVADDGRVLVADFGLARDHHTTAPRQPTVVGMPSNYPSPTTEQGVVAGTPGYLAPECLGGRPASPAADQYAFCVTVWQALTGTVPVPSEDPQAPGWPPPWPSTVSAPRQVARALSIGLARDPTQRWPSVAAMLGALAPSPRRRRMTWGLLGLGGVLVWALLPGHHPTAMCGGATDKVGQIWNETRAATLRSTLRDASDVRAEQAWDKLEPQFDRYAQQWAQAHASACDASKAADRDGADLDLQMACLRRAAQSLDTALRVFTEVDGAMHAFDVEGQLPSLARCGDLDVLRDHARTGRARASESIERVIGMLTEIRILREAGLRQQAERSLARAEQLAADEPDDPIFAALALEHAMLEASYGRRGRYEAGLRNALSLGIEHGDNEIVRTSAMGLALLLAGWHADPEDATHFRDLAARVVGADAGDRMRLHLVGSAIGMAQGDLAAEENELRQALAIAAEAGLTTAPLVIQCQNNLAAVLMRGTPRPERLAEAERLLQRTLDTLREQLGPQHPDLIGPTRNLASVLLMHGSLSQAETELRGALQIAQDALPSPNPITAGLHAVLGEVQQHQGRLELSAASFERSLAMFEGLVAPGNPERVATIDALGQVRFEQGRTDEGLELLERAQRLRVRTQGARHPEVTIASAELGRYRWRSGNAVDALTLVRDSWEVLGESHGLDDPQMAQVTELLVSVLLDLDRPGDALPHAQALFDAVQDDPHVDPMARPAAAFGLARALWGAQGPNERARQLLQQARAELATAGDAGAPLATRIRAWTEREPSRAAVDG